MNTIKNSYEYYEGNQSLLNMLNKKKQGNPLINQIIINNQNAYQKKMESMGIYKATGTDKYSKVTKASNCLLDAIDNVTKDELYQQEKEKEYDKAPLLKSVSNFITAYNNQISNLNNCGGTLNSEFSKELHIAYSANKAGLNEIGITEDKDGKIILVQEKFNNSPLDKIMKIFSKKSEYIGALKSSTESITDILGKAQAMKSASYNSKGLFN